MTENKHQNSKDNFKNRRRMAWLTLSSFLGVVLYIVAFVDPSVISNYTGILGVLSGVVTLVLGYYYGTSSYEHVNTKQEISDWDQSDENY